MEYEQALIDENRAFGDVVLAADPATPILTCPGWSMLQLLRHVGRGDRWAAHIVGQRAAAEIDPRTVPEGRPPDDPEGARAWLHDGVALLLEATRGAGPDERVWTFLGPQPPSWWVRRRLHEATIHRADAAIALGLTYQLRSGIAADAIEEWLDRLAIELRTSGPALKSGTSLVIQPTDTGVGWVIHGTPEGIDWRHHDGDTQVDLRLVGPVTGLLLALVRRQSADAAGVQIDGDPQLWTTWLARTPL